MSVNPRKIRAYSQDYPLSAHQLHRMLGLTYKSAWFMVHRIRYAMEQKPLAEKLGGIVEADECYIGRKLLWESNRGRPSPKSRQQPVVALIERGGRVRSFHVGAVTSENLRKVLTDNIEAEARLMTDELDLYQKAGQHFASHETVQHGEK